MAYHIFNYSQLVITQEIMGIKRRQGALWKYLDLNNILGEKKYIYFFGQLLIFSPFDHFDQQFSKQKVVL